MKKLIAPLVALLMAPACGGEREQAPGPQSPVGPPSEGAAETPPATTETPTVEPTPAPPAAKVSKTDLVQDTVRSLISAFNAHDARRIASLYTPDAVVAGVGSTGWIEASGRTVIETSYGQLFTAFPDVKWASPRVHVTQDAAIQEWALTGTHQGELGGMAPTQRTAGVHGAAVYFFDDEGRIRRQHTYYDALAMSAQLGTYKGKGRAAATLPTGDTQFMTATGSTAEGLWLDAARTYYNAYETRDEKALNALLAADATHTSYLLPDDRKGNKAVAEDFRGFLRAFPDIDIETKNMWGFGPHVITESVITTKKAGAWAGAKATQKPATLHVLDVLHFSDEGKLASIVTYGSPLELMVQSGQETKGVHPWLPAGRGTGQGTTPGQSPMPGQYPMPGQSPTPGQYPMPGQNPMPGQGGSSPMTP